MSGIQHTMQHNCKCRGSSEPCDRRKCTCFAAFHRQQQTCLSYFHLGRLYKPEIDRRSLFKALPSDCRRTTLPQAVPGLNSSNPTRIQCCTISGWNTASAAEERREVRAAAS